MDLVDLMAYWDTYTISMLKSQIFVADNDSKQQYIANNASFQIIYPCNVADVFVVVIGFGVWVHVSENILLFCLLKTKTPKSQMCLFLCDVHMQSIRGQE